MDRIVVLLVGVATLSLQLAPAEAGAPPSPVGDALPALAPVMPETVGVVASSAANRGRVAVIVQNGTDGPVTDVRVQGSATSAEGGTATKASSRGLVPASLAPGAYGLTVLDFGRTGAPPDAAVSFRVTWKTASTGTDRKLLEVGTLTRSLPMTGRVAQTISFPVTNPGTRAVAGPITATVMCFNEAGTPVNVTTTTVRRGGLAPGRTATVTARLAQLCPAAWVAVRSA